MGSRLLADLHAGRPLFCHMKTQICGRWHWLRYFLYKVALDSQSSELAQVCWQWPGLIVGPIKLGVRHC